MKRVENSSRWWLFIPTFCDYFNSSSFLLKKNDFELKVEEGVVPFDNVVSIFTGFNLQLLSHTFDHKNHKFLILICLQVSYVH